MDGLFVAFSAFEPFALDEADSKNLWTIHRCSRRVVFMFDTDRAARERSHDGCLERYADLYDR